MKAKNFSAKTGSRPDSSARARRRAPGIGRRQIQLGLEEAHLLGAAETLGQKMDEGGVKVVNGGAIDGQLRRNSAPASAHAVRLRSPTLVVELSVPDPAW